MIGPSFLIVMLKLHCWVTIDDNWLFLRIYKETRFFKDVMNYVSDVNPWLVVMLEF